MKESSLISKAQSQIEAVKNKTLSPTKRKDLAIALAAMMLEEAGRIQTFKERRQQAQLARMMSDPKGKAFTTSMTDQSFRSRRFVRIADQLIYLLQKYGIPKYLSSDRRLSLDVFKLLGTSFSNFLVPLTIQMLRRETRTVILPGEKELLIKHIERRRREGVRVNINHLGEAILGEEEAHRRLHVYMEDLSKSYIEYISVKISTIYSQINLLDWDQTLDKLAERLRQLYRAAIKHLYQRADGSLVPKFVNLDMEEYRDLKLTVALFRKVLDEPEFINYSAGIVLQAYLPESFAIQQELTQWAMQRVAQGGAPIKIRLVKGANLAMEQVEAALRLWPQAPYTTKLEVDANYKRLITYGCQKEQAQAVHLGIGSHNLLDIAYALLLRAENGVEKEVNFEMLEGMADHIRRVVQKLAGNMLLYCPVATKDEFQNAVAYLVRRLDENTAPENFLRHAFGLKPRTPEWKNQATFFTQACLLTSEVSNLPRRTQNRLNEVLTLNEEQEFKNEPDTDWTLESNQQWAKNILQEWSQKKHSIIPLVIGGQTVHSEKDLAQAEDPSHPFQILYQYTLATQQQVDLALEVAKKSKKQWAETAISERISLLKKVALELRRQRASLIGAMVADTGKTVMEADVEISEAIDFVEYYCCSLQQLSLLQDISWSPKGLVLVTPPWNFPCSIPVGGIAGSLAAGNCVLFKPAPEAVLVGWQLVQIFWKAGISQDVLQFINCEDEPVGSLLIKDPRVNTVILTGATETAKLFLQLRPDLDLIAETGGKNTLVITALADRDLAIKDLIQSAFGHAGQKCSACSLAIIEAEVYEDPHFRQQLRDAAASLAVGSAWDLKTRINPLIRLPNATLLRGLTVLEEGEEWLLEPKQDAHNPNLWSPGIKMGVTPESFTFQNELFGPVLALVRAKNFQHALDLINQTPYGLTAGIHSLDEREVGQWFKNIEAGNCYVNRTITGAVVQRQPFGGCKESSFGRGAKAGGPNYLTQLMLAKQDFLPREQEPESAALTFFVNQVNHELSKEEQVLWQTSLKSYTFYWEHYFSKRLDPSLILGQDNLQSYAPHSQIVLRVQDGDTSIDILRVIAAALICQTPLEISFKEPKLQELLNKCGLLFKIRGLQETEDQFIQRLSNGRIKRVRLLRPASRALQKALANAACRLNVGEVLANGRLELLHYLREVSLSRDYHRYGNLGDREQEHRTPLPFSPGDKCSGTCPNRPASCCINKTRECGKCEFHE